MGEEKKNHIFSKSTAKRPFKVDMKSKWTLFI